MNWLQRTVAKVAKIPLPKAHYKAGRPNRAFGTTANSTGPNQATIPYLPLLRARVRDQVRNSASADGAIETLVSETIGTGIIPLPSATGNLKDALTSMWEKWGAKADFDGVLDIYGMQALVDRAWKESGEVFARFIVVPYDGGDVVPLRIQLLEADMVPLANGTAPGSRNEIRNGIEFHGGRRVAYWVHKTHPGEYLLFSKTGGAFDGVYNEQTMIRVPDDEMLHVYRPTRPGQLRGVPRLSGVLPTIAELSDFDEATLERQKLASAITAFIRRPVPIDAGTDPVTGKEIDPDLVTESEINPGSAYTLLPGEEIEFPDMPELGKDYAEFVKHHERQVASGAGIPYELLTGDYSGTNDRTVRVALGVFRRKLQQDQWHIIVPQFCQPVWNKVVQVGILNSLASISAAKVLVTWTPQVWPYINPLQDVQTQAAEITAGLSSRTAKITERGDDPERVDADRAEDKRREDALGISVQAVDPPNV
ncbi:MAG: phage portal protein [Chlorobiaceae bacterium]|nr:phage portal protein [Chlorobiaceae bacterium]